eukprot:TRINITY_DN24969_c0_g1_i1.p1 TRINITY_DN24969_c0_g1~~TRINITY_DN24969_c0_g1_i1.p1  ORF type:complete len:838 (+),score=84.61 TRINITY_DN24969_c0_g1_i1:133-2646(+)
MDLLDASGWLTWAYSYNMGRFQFDAGQAQTTEYQAMALRIAQWKLYREDARDTFSLTSDAMTSYMTVAALVLTSTVASYQDWDSSYPVNPVWMKRFWVNSMMECMVYASLCLWFSMHGCVLAQTGCVKALTQAIRIPLPTRSELEASQWKVEQYEANPSQWVSGFGNPWQDAAGSPSGSETPVKPTKKRGRKDMEMLRDEHGGGPGRLATSDSAHIELLRRMSAAHAGFDAYARVSLSVSAHQFVLGIIYHVMGHQMVSHRDNQGIVLPSMMMVVTILIILFKLDLYVQKTSMRLLTYVTFFGPVFFFWAVKSWNSLHDPVMPQSRDLSFMQYVTEAMIYAALIVNPKIPMILSSLCHLTGCLIVLWHAYPSPGILQLPTQWRVARHLDIFGWLAKSKDTPSHNIVTAEGDAVLGDTHIAEEHVGSELTPSHFAETLSADPSGSAPATGRPMGTSEVAAVPRRPGSHVSSSSLPWRYFLRIGIFESVTWVATIIWTFFLPGATHGMNNLRAQTVGVQWPKGLSTPVALACSGTMMVLTDGLNLFASVGVSVLHEPLQMREKEWQQESPPSLLRPFHVPLPKDEAIAHAVTSSSWKGFAVVNERVLLKLGQGGRTILELPISLILPRERGGSDVPMPSVNTEGPRCWTVGSLLGGSLHAIAVARDKNSCNGVQREGAVADSHAWSGLYGATERGDVVLFCRKETMTNNGCFELQPQHVVISAGSSRGRADELIGMQADGTGLLWILALAPGGPAHTTHARTELVAWSTLNGAHNGSWVVPRHGRGWVHGVCVASDGKKVVLASKTENSAYAASTGLVSNKVRSDSAPWGQTYLWSLHL